MMCSSELAHGGIALSSALPEHSSGSLLKPALNPGASVFVSSPLSRSECSSPGRLSSPERSSEQLVDLQLPRIRILPANMPGPDEEERIAGHSSEGVAQQSEPASYRPADGAGPAAPAGPADGDDASPPAPEGGPHQRQDRIPAPGFTRQRSSSSLSSAAGGSPPHPVMHHPHPGMGYGWYGGYAAPMYYERAASPPGHHPHYYPAGSSPPLPTGFISVPLHASGGGAMPPHLGQPGSPPGGMAMLPGGSPPQHYHGGSPPMPGSPPGMGMMYLGGPPPHLGQGGGYPGHRGGGGPGAAQYHPGMQYLQAQHSGELAQGMANLSFGGSPNGRAPGEPSRASARIARSHRAGGAYDPASFAFSLEEAEGGAPGARTTLMIRNIPNKYSSEAMVSVLEKAGFKGTYDFFYLPIDFRNRCNLGYAFVNFTTPGATARLYRQFHAKRWDEFNSKKVCEVSYGRLQGRDALVEHFRASKFPSDDAEYMPLVYTRVDPDTGVASGPVAIHEYLGTSPTGGSDDGCGDAAGQ